jgi:molecular chaperone GrpE
MKHKEKQEPKEEKTSPHVLLSQDSSGGGIADFYGLLESLLPQKSELLADLRAAMEDCKKRSEETLPSDKNEADYALALEKEKTKCLLELYKIALNQYLRISADYANYQKRVPKQIADAIGYEKEKIIGTLLPTLDNFERTLQNAQAAEATDSIVKGIKIIYGHTLDILRSHGVEQIKAVGEKFEPTLHEAVTQRDEPGKEEGIVLEEFAKGYKLNGRVIRPSKVIVNKVTSKSQKASEQEETTDTE